MDERTLLSGSEDKMKKVVDAFKKFLASTRAGRATPTLLEKVVVDYYGVPTPVNQVASIGVQPPRTLIIQPWDKKMLFPIEKAVQKADLGAMPVSDANLVRLTIPPLTKERRQEIVKSLRKQSENEKVSIRNIRRDCILEVKTSLKDKEISEDESHRIQEKAQKLTDKYVQVIEDLTDAKEKEVMEV